MTTSSIIHSPASDTSATCGASKTKTSSLPCSKLFLLSSSFCPSTTPRGPLSVRKTFESVPARRREPSHRLLLLACAQADLLMRL